MEIVINREDNESFTHFLSKKTSPNSQADANKQIQSHKINHQSKDLDTIKANNNTIESNSLKHSRSLNENMFSQQFNMSLHENEPLKPQNH